MRNVLANGLHIDILPLPINYQPFIKTKRKCKIKNCCTILTGYNNGEYCHTHKHIIALMARDKYVKKINSAKNQR